jgi:hypothetical protein
MYSEARVSTDRPNRYAKQLAAHLGRRLETNWHEETGHGSVIFPEGGGTASLVAEQGALVLSVDTTEESIDTIEDVLGRHLARFGAKDELIVEWHRDNGTSGTVQRNE